MAMQAATSTGLVGVGYEGWKLTEFVDQLIAEGVDHLVDVRLTPISRKPGFSKTALREALAGAGIGYEHRPELGNPRPNRAGFAGDAGALDRARAVYAASLSEPAAAQAVHDLAVMAQSARVAVLCFEADQDRCHRDVVLAYVAKRRVSKADSRRPAR
jgi:uncharacterized protein (DUF488 family)